MGAGDDEERQRLIPPGAAEAEEAQVDPAPTIQPRRRPLSSVAALMRGT